MWGFHRSSRLSQPSNEAYEFLSSSDSEGAASDTLNLVGNRVLAEDDGGRSSSESSTTPTPSRAPSPSLYPSHRPSFSISEADGSPASPLLFSPGIRRGDVRNWWNLSPNSRRRRKRERTVWRALKKAARRIVRHSLFPRQPLTIVRMDSPISSPHHTHGCLDFRPSPFHTVCNFPYALSHVRIKSRQRATALESILFHPCINYTPSKLPLHATLSLYQSSLRGLREFSSRQSRHSSSSWGVSWCFLHGLSAGTQNACTDYLGYASTKSKRRGHKRWWPWHITDHCSFHPGSTPQRLGKAYPNRNGK